MTKLDTLTKLAKLRKKEASEKMRQVVRTLLLLTCWLVDPSSGRAARQAAAARQLRGRTCACCSSKPCASTFQVRVRIGSEELTQEFQPLFSASEMLTVRLPLPLDLRAAPYAGTLRIIEDAYSLLRGDVIRYPGMQQHQKSIHVGGLMERFRTGAVPLPSRRAASTRCGRSARCKSDKGVEFRARVRARVSCSSLVKWDNAPSVQPRNDQIFLGPTGGRDRG